MHKLYNYTFCLAKMLYNGHLSEEMAEEWVSNMTPNGKHWSKAETDDVLSAYNLTYNHNDWYAVLNMMYSDYFGAVSNDTETYVKLV